jgi:hypothetical protein
MTSALTWGRWLPKWAITIGILYTLVVQTGEGYRQFQLSKTLFQPQVELARWVEQNVSSSDSLIFDNVPACWLRRKENHLELFSWFDVPVFSSPKNLLDWSEKNNVKYILYFEEEWTKAPTKARFLEQIDSELDVNGRKIVLVQAEDQYGWRWFKLSN